MNTLRKTLSVLASATLFIGLIIGAALQTSCGPDQQTSCGPDQQTVVNSKPRQLNISILLDLSDRIDCPSAPSQISKDTAIVNHIVDIFRKDMDKFGAFDAEGKIQIQFEPKPSIANIDSLQRNLKVDLRGMDTRQKKGVFDNIQSMFQSTLVEIYNETSKNKKHSEGSDIWRFFKNDVVDLCIDKDTNYRNILVIITDGYIYEKNTIQKVNNRVQNLTKNTIGKYQECADPIEAIKKDDFGLMSSRKDLNNLEVLILEVNPENNSQKDELILTYCLEKWMGEMGVIHSKVYKTDLPSNTAGRIMAFFDQD